MPAMTNFFLWSEPAAPVDRLKRRVKMQEAALRQARLDLAAGLAREGLPSIEEPFESVARPRDSFLFLTEEPEAPDASPSVYISDAHRRQHAIDERRRRGLPIEESDAAATAEFSEFVRRSDEKRRGVNQPDILPPPPPQPPPARMTAEEILAAIEGGEAVQEMTEQQLRQALANARADIAAAPHVHKALLERREAMLTDVDCRRDHRHRRRDEGAGYQGRNR